MPRDSLTTVAGDFAVRSTEVIIIGAGAAGLMCALTAAGRGRQVLLLDHANKPG
ncbi:MAG: FAD-dependent oxidoreductase, partial [Pseudomonas sp.]